MATESEVEYPCISEDHVQTGYVTRVIDGDTIVAMINGQEYRIRYIGINTPEVGDSGAEVATDANAYLVYHKEVNLYRDVSETDKYGRLLRYVVADGIFVNYELVLQGAAKAGYWEPDTACRASLEEAEEKAQIAEIGIWQSD
jgi:endonuclease YncB( thermonuclease family)